MCIRDRRRPNNGAKIPENCRSEVKVLYDDTGVYFGATLYDNEPSKIAKELTVRDNIETDDIFGVTINGYNDHQQSLEFLVLPSGVQFDAKLLSLIHIFHGQHSPKKYSNTKQNLLHLQLPLFFHGNVQDLC